ncbi:kelch-like protein 26 isoform X2 [Cylas formicarius]|uniref:kelch-like protein 26 isoform X2 n=1 Tax=Cylas formicarius TaxID=197179 RepID=UPI0029589DD8|nr:kelch-like protein 26 isoform X2 [Cylas formicarius]
MTKTKERYLHDKPLHTIFYEHSSHLGTLLEGLNSLRQKGELLDITLVIEGSLFQAHKAVLSACSDYFRAMFTDNMLEARKNEICLNGITAKGFHQLLEYAYTSHLALNLANVQDVLEAASHVQMVNCIQACSNYLQSQIDLDNCVDIVTIAETYSLGQLRMKVYRFMSGHLLEFSNSSEFYRLTPQQLENLLGYDFPVDCSEADVLSIVLAWFFHTDKRDVDYRLTYAVRIMKYIHFKEITKRKLDSILEKILEERNYEWQILYRIILQQVYVQSNTGKTMDMRLNLLNSRGMEMAVLKIGGFGISGITNEITYCFASKRKWKHLTSIPHVEQCNYGTAVFNNELYIVGGCFNQSLQENIHPFGFKYSPRYNKWSTMSPMKIERCRFSLNVVGDMLYAVGGTSEGDENVTCTCECYNPRLDLWYTIPDMPAHLSQHAGVSSGCRLFISENWKTCASMLQPRADHVMLSIGKYLYVCGGWTEDIEMRSRLLVDTIDVYDTEKDTWEILTKVPTPRYHAGIVCVENKIYFVGGFHSDAVFDKDTAAIEYYNIENNMWTIEEKYPQDIWEHTCATLYIPKCRDDMEVIPTTESSV